MPPEPSAITIKRIHREISDLKKEDLGCMTLKPAEDSLFDWRGSIPGPESSCYEGGVFWIEIHLPPDYPFSAPRVTFTTRIYHMNISDRGNVCIDLLKNNWSPALSLYKVLLSLSSLLTDPNPKDPLVPQIASQYLKDRAQFNKTARHWTELYALPPSVSSKSHSSNSLSKQPETLSSPGEIIVIDGSTERPSRRKRDRTGSVAEGRQKRANNGTTPSAGGSGSTSPDVIIIDD